MKYTTNAARQKFDTTIQDITDYVIKFNPANSKTAMTTARYCLLDSIGCAMLALQYPACVKLLGPVVEGANLPGGVRVPGTSYELEPVQAAFNIGATIRWLDYNDTWLAAEWGHPSDNLAAILSLADYISRNNRRQGKAPLQVTDILQATIKAHEIQGILALENAFNRVGLDHVMLVRIASTAVAAKMLGCNRNEILNAVSNSWIDGCSLRTYRHAPNTGSRKSWAAGDASARGVRLALIARTGEMGYPSAITAPIWGFNDALMRDGKVKVARKYSSYVMENVLFKISYPAEFHAQTAVEACVTLHKKEADNSAWLDNIKEIRIETQEAGKRIIDKTGELDNPADRDHCIQYMSAVALLKGTLTAADYEDGVAADKRIDKLRDKMTVTENPTFTKNYFDSSKRAIGNAVQIFYNDGTNSARVKVEYPIGHHKRRKEGIPLLEKKFLDAIASRLSAKQCEELQKICFSQSQLEKMPADDFMSLMKI